MSAQTAIDPIRFAQEAQRLVGEFPLAEMDRLRDDLAEEHGVVSWDLQGAVVGGRPALRLRIEANPTLICQRCLAPYVQLIESEGLLFLARNDAELERWESDDPLIDVIVAEARLDVRTLIEDELLLSLPVVPRHEDDDCPRREDVLGAH